MKKILLTVSCIVILAISSQSQDMDQTYTTALGLRVWRSGAGVTLKHFVAPNHALEGIGYFWRGGARITGLYEIHFDIANAPGLKWYIGPGAHIGFYSNGYEDPYGYYNHGNGNNNGGAYFGIDGVLGLDYKFNKAPINLSLDWQPSFEFGDGRGFYGSWGGLGIRYTF